MTRTRIVAASLGHHAAAELCALIERSGVNVGRRCNAITTGVTELVAGVMPEIVGDAWHYPSRSRLGQVHHTVTSTIHGGGRRRLLCTCEAGDLDSACWHRGHRALVEHMAARPDASDILAIDLSLVWPGPRLQQTTADAHPAAGGITTIASPTPAAATHERKGRLAARAEADFWAKYALVIGSRSMSDVEALLDKPVPRPRTAEGWVSLGEQVEQAHLDPSAEHRLSEIGAKLNARRGIAAPRNSLTRKSAQEEIDELFPPKV